MKVGDRVEITTAGFRGEMFVGKRGTITDRARFVSFRVLLDDDPEVTGTWTIPEKYMKVI